MGVLGWWDTNQQGCDGVNEVDGAEQSANHLPIQTVEFRFLMQSSHLCLSRVLRRLGGWFLWLEYLPEGKILSRQPGFSTSCYARHSPITCQEFVVRMRLISLVVFDLRER